MKNKYCFQIVKVFLLTLLILPNYASLAQQADSLAKLPPTQWTRPRKIDVKHIALDLSFDRQKKQAIGSATITLSPLHATNVVALDAAKMSIKSIVLSNGTPLTFEYEGGEKDNNLNINLGHIYQPNEDVAIKIMYNTNWVNETDPNTLGGSNGKGLRFFQPTTTEPRKRTQIWSMSEAESNRYWFPCHDVLNDVRTTELTATVGEKLTVVSNGNLLSTKENKDGTRTFHWKMDKPYPNYQTSIVVGEYTEIVRNTEGVSLHTFSYPDEVEATKVSTVRLPDMLHFFSEKTGLNYPFARYSQVFVQDLPWGMANIGASTLTENMVDDYGTHEDYLYLWDALEAESLAQQWFGNTITCGDWAHIWLNRAFPRYFDGLYDAYKNGREEYLLYPHLWDYGTYLGDWNTGNRHPIVTKNYENKTIFASDNYGNFRGALVLHSLRKQLGEGNWWKVIKQYVKTNAHKSVITEDFRKSIEHVTGEPMDWFFDQWVYKMGHPIFEVTKNYEASKRQLTLIVKQVQKIDSSNLYPQVAFFQGKIEIEIDGKIEPIWLEPKAENVFNFTCSEQPKIVGFDYENSWIKEAKFEKTLDEWLYQFQNDSDILGRRWAMTEIVKIAKKETTSAIEKAKIYEAFRTVISSTIYWRFKWMALIQFQGLLAINQPVTLDKITTDFLLSTIKKEKKWVRASAISCLGISQDAQFADLYIPYLRDSSDRVVNAAAIALGKSKSPKAFDALIQLKNKPSWKSQSLISSLNGLKELKDINGYETAINALKDADAAPHWTLAVPTWDFRIAAAETLVALGKGTEGYPIVLKRFQKSLEENDLSDIFNNVLLITTLADPRGQVVFDELKIKYKDDAAILNAVNQFETQFKEALKKP